MNAATHTYPGAPHREGKAIPTLEDVKKAACRLKPFLPPTPMLYRPGHGAYLKLESLQVTGAYKVRGALNALLVQRERDDLRPVHAASAGNHGAAVAWAAHRLGLCATITVPRSAPRAKVLKIAQLGARVVRHGGTFHEAALFAEAQAEAEGARLLHAFDDPDIIAGQGTMALELLGVRPDVVVAPIGGGGLASGLGLVLQACGVKLIGVQVEGIDSLRRAMLGHPSHVEPPTTVADGLRVSEAGYLTRELCRAFLDRIEIVTEDEVRGCMLRLATEDGLIVEGAGAVAVAALSRVPGARRVALVTGGNVDLDTLAHIGLPLSAH